MAKWIFIMSMWCLSLLPGQARELPEIRWQTLPDLPLPSGGHLVVAQNDTIHVLGGTYWKNGVKHWLDRSLVLESSADGWQWRQLSKLPLALGYPAAGIDAASGSLVLSGGTVGVQRANTGIYIRSANDGKEWRQAASDAGLPCGAAFASDGRRLLACGGLPQPDRWTNVSNQVMSLDLANPAAGWSAEGVLPGAGRAFGAMCFWRGKYYLFGGADAGIRNLKEAWCFDPERRIWTRQPDMPTATRCSLALPWRDWIILIPNCETDAKGNTAASNRIFFFNPVNARWHEGGTSPYLATADGTISGDRIYLIGGEDRGMSRVADCAMGILKMPRYE